MDGTMLSTTGVTLDMLFASSQIVDAATSSGGVSLPSSLTCTGIYVPTTVYANGDNETWPSLTGTTIGSQIGWKYKTCSGGTWAPDASSGTTSDWYYGCAMVAHAVYSTGCVWSGCTTGYIPTGSPGCQATSGLVSGACTGLPANAVYYGSSTGHSLSDAQPGTSLAASYTGGTIPANTCEYNCAGGSVWNGSTCAGLVSGACTSLPSHAVYYGSGTSYSLVNASPGTSLAASYTSSTIPTNTCEYNCANNYAWDGSVCANLVSGACTGLPANAVYYGSGASYSLTDAPLGTSILASYTGGTIPTNTCEYNCAGGYAWNGTGCALIYTDGQPYISSLAYSAGQNFTWNGATVTVTGPGMGTSSTTTPGCDTPDIAVWQDGTNNIQIWAACNMGATAAWTGGSLSITDCAGGSTDCDASLRSTLGDYYQWGRNDVVTSDTYTTGQYSGILTGGSTSDTNFYQGDGIYGEWYMSDVGNTNPARWSIAGGGDGT